MTAMAHLVTEVLAYCKEREKFLTPQSYFLPVWPELKQTFGSFLLNRNLSALHCLMTMYNEMFGYMPFDLLPAYYGLMFYEPLALNAIFLHKYLLYKDNAALLVNLTPKMQLDIHLNTGIFCNRRWPEVSIGYRNGTMDETFDFII